MVSNIVLQILSFFSKAISIADKAYKQQISTQEVENTVKIRAYKKLIFGSGLDFGGLGGTVVRRRAHNPRVVCSVPALATFEDSILGQGVNTNCASLHPGV